MRTSASAGMKNWNLWPASEHRAKNAGETNGDGASAAAISPWRLRRRPAQFELRLTHHEARMSYSKFSEEDLGIEMEDLLRALSDYLLQSGYQDPYMQFSEMNEHTLEELKQRHRARLGERRAIRSGSR